MNISVTKLRADLYNLVDQVIATGIPVTIERNGHIVKLISIEKISKLKNLKPHPEIIIGDPEQLIHNDWLEEWNGGDL